MQAFWGSQKVAHAVELRNQYTHLLRICNTTTRVRDGQESWGQQSVGASVTSNGDMNQPTPVKNLHSDKSPRASSSTILCIQLQKSAKRHEESTASLTIWHDLPPPPAVEHFMRQMARAHPPVLGPRVQRVAEDRRGLAWRAQRASVMVSIAHGSVRWSGDEMRSSASIDKALASVSLLYCKRRVPYSRYEGRYGV